MGPLPTFNEVMLELPAHLREKARRRVERVAPLDGDPGPPPVRQAWVEVDLLAAAGAGLHALGWVEAGGLVVRACDPDVPYAPPKPPRPTPDRAARAAQRIRAAESDEAAAALLALVLAGEDV